MQKTRLGISVGLLGAAIYFSGLFGGLLVTILLAGYVLLFETNGWLRHSAVKAAVTLVFFAFILAIVGLIPDLISFINSIFYLFDDSFTLEVVTKLVNIVTIAIGILRTVVFLILGVKALNQGTISIPFVDGLVNKFVG